MGKRSAQTRKPRVGIFWLFNRKLILDSTPLSDAESYGNVLNEPREHVNHWVVLQRQGIFPSDVDYEEIPRGRVGYYKREERFWLRADRCILKRKDVVRRIMSALSLPDNTLIEKDDHYRCAACLRRQRRLSE